MNKQHEKLRNILFRKQYWWKTVSKLIVIITTKITKMVVSGEQCSQRNDTGDLDFLKNRI